MGFILIDFKKKDERKRLRKLVPHFVQQMAMWVSIYQNEDGAPPNEEECQALEDEQIAMLVDKFNAEADNLQRVKEEHSRVRDRLELELGLYRGRLFSKFSDEVDALKNQAEDTLKYCMKSLQEEEEELKESMPMAENQIEAEFKQLLASMTAHIDRVYPGGVDGLDSYDDELPEGIPSFADFKAMLVDKEAEYKEMNQETIPAALEEIKGNTTTMVKTKINEAIKAAMKDIVEDLSDDVLPYLDEDAMAGLRAELIASAKEYGTSRLD
mmetsp:Transcript_33047/g.46921  ORF Transcript_33047/g.46921 Transcript_33047/m.46921 type:complete len:269 (-) Transcript_33047:108-914(-)